MKLISRRKCSWLIYCKLMTILSILQVVSLDFHCVFSSVWFKCNICIIMSLFPSDSPGKVLLLVERSEVDWVTISKFGSAVRSTRSLTLIIIFLCNCSHQSLRAEYQDSSFSGTVYITCQMSFLIQNRDFTSYAPNLLSVLMQTSFPDLPFHPIGV